MVSIFNNTRSEKIYYINYLNLHDHLDALSSIDHESSVLNVLVTFPIDEAVLQKIYRRLHKLEILTDYIFPVASEQEVETGGALIDKLQMDRFALRPCYNGGNLQFFKKNVFLNKSHLLGARPSLKTILRRGIVNPVFYGRLSVLPNRRVYANLNMPSLGRIGEQSLHEMVYKELRNTTGWRRLRKHVKPCRSCVYQNICPPLSNYEFVIARNNLCTVNIK